MSIQHKYRHLLRSLASDDLLDLWTEADDLLATAFDSIRGASASAARRSVDRSVLSLPTRLGGIGVYSNVECLPHARAAADALSDNVLAALVPGLAPLDTVPTQQGLCGEAFLARREALLSTLTLREQVSLAEGASMVGRRFLSAIPSSARFTMTNSDIQAALHYRTLLPGHDSTCPRCGAPNELGHDEACKNRKDYRVSRHEAVKHHIASALRSVPTLQVTVEPFINGIHGRRNDVAVHDFGGDRVVLSEEYDIKVTSLFSDTNLAQLSTRPPPADTVADTISAKVQAVLALHAARKRSNLPRRSEAGQQDAAPFVPIIISAGGVLHTDTRDKFREWKSWGVSKAAHSWLLTSISVSLARARGRTFSRQ